MLRVYVFMPIKYDAYAICLRSSLYFLIEAHTVFFFFFFCFCFLLTQVRATTLGSRSGFRRTNAWLERTQFSGGSTRAVFMKLTLRGKQRV